MAGAGDGSRHLVYRDPNTPDGCLPARTAVTAAAASSGGGGSSKQPVYRLTAATNSSKHPPPLQQQQHQQQRKDAQGHTKDTRVAAGGSSGGSSSGVSSGSSTGRRLLRFVADVSGTRGSNADSSSTTGINSGSGFGRRLLQLLADISAAAGYLADSSSAVGSSGSSGSSKGSSESVDNAIAESSSKSRVACWRQVYEWPFGEDGRVWGFDQDAVGMFITSSVGRWA